MSAGVFINEIVFSDGFRLELQDNSIVVFVGPNNSGKSLSLREILSNSISKKSTNKAIREVRIQKIGDEQKVLDALAAYAGKDTGTGKQFYIDQYESVSKDTVREIWNSPSERIGDIAKFFIGHLTTSIRLSDCEPVETYDARKRSGGYHPIHHLYQNTQLEDKISDLFRKAFGYDLVTHRLSGREIPLFVGERPALADGEQVIDRTYIDKIEKLAPLDEQGDGFKSFASLLLRVWTGIYTVLLIDEPEAFLHPPQARMVGEFITMNTDDQKQIFIATHSIDILQGLIGKESDRLSIIRIQRNMNEVKFTHLSSHDVSRLWQDPILRYSNVLNGLFHRNVVVAEADGDCRFYEALAGAIARTDDDFYTYSGGKDRIPVIARAMRALEVPIQIIVDIDILSQDSPLDQIVTANGNDWEEFKGEVHFVRRCITEKKAWLVGSSFKSQIKDILNRVSDGDAVPNEELKRLKSIVRQASPWDAVKLAGSGAVASGDPNKRLTELLTRLKMAGVFVVPVGEMERFCKSVGSHGPRWVQEVLQKDLAHDRELHEAREFVADLHNFSQIKPLPRHDIQERPTRVSSTDFFSPVVEAVKTESAPYRYARAALAFFGFYVICAILYQIASKHLF